MNQFTDVVQLMRISWTGKMKYLREGRRVCHSSQNSKIKYGGPANIWLFVLSHKIIPVSQRMEVMF